MSHSLKFCFKGDRDYVHGTDIVPAIFQYFEKDALTDIDIKFNSMSKTGLDLCEGDDAREASVNIRLLQNSEPKFYQLVENGQAITCRSEYDEQQILDQSLLDIEKKSVSLNSVTGFSLSENFVAMNKYLLLSLFPEAEGKWLFTRLEQFERLPDDLLITVVFKKNFKFRLVQSSVHSGEKHIANLYFTLA